MTAKMSYIANVDTWYIKRYVYAIKKNAILSLARMTNLAKQESLLSISEEQVVSEIICFILRF